MVRKVRGKNNPKCSKPEGVILPNLSKYIITEAGVYSTLINAYLRGSLGMRGYLQVCLKCDDGKRRWFAMHRLIATAYLPNPDGLPIAHHRDHNKLNNCVSNLEWVSAKQNIRFAIAAGRWNTSVRGLHMKGRKLPLETRQKMSESHTGVANYKFRGLYSYMGVTAPTQKALGEALGLSRTVIRGLWREGYIDIVPAGTPSYPPPVYREEAPTYSI